MVLLSFFSNKPLKCLGYLSCTSALQRVFHCLHTTYFSRWWGKYAKYWPIKVDF